MNPRISRAALLGAMIVVVLGLEMKWAEAAGPPYPYGYCKDVTLGGSPFPATAECAVDTNSGTVGDMAYSDGVGAAGARAEEGTTGNFSCGLEDRVSTGGYTIDFYAAMVGVGDVTRINW